jgi:hypothetical protein
MGIIDISTPEEPVASSLFPVEDVTTSVRVDGDFAYISTISSGVQAIDITNKTEPIHNPAWIYDASGASSLGLFPGTNAIFCANDQFGLQKLDITDKSNIQPLASHNTPADAIAIDVFDNYIYSVDDTVGNAPEKEGLRIHFIDTLYEPGEVNFIFNYKGFCATPGTATDIAVDGNYAYVADGNQGLQIVSVTDKTSPEIIGNYDTSGNAGGIFIDGNYAYVADGEQGIVIIDITDKSNPTLTDNFDIDGYARKIFVSGDYAYVAADDQGLVIINIFNKTDPVDIGVYDTPGTASGIYVKDNYAYVADGEKGISIIDISDKTTPTLTGTLDTDGFAENISVSTNYVYVADGLNGLSTIDASNPSLPVSMSEWSYNSSGITTDVFSGYFSEDEKLYTFLADGAAGIIAINLSIDKTSDGGTGSCIIQKLKAFEKLWKSYVKCYAKEMKKPGSITACNYKAMDKFIGSWNKAEQKAFKKGEYCETADPAVIKDMISQATADIYTQICQGLDASDKEAVKLGGMLLKAAEKRVSSILKAQSNFLKKPDAGKSQQAIAKAEDKFTASWDKAMAQAIKKGVTYTDPSANDIETMTDALVDDILDGML